MVVSSGENQGKTTRCGITEVPNCVMESIVSLLPLKDAVNTIMASPPQWRTLSHPILTRPDLEFNHLNVLGSDYTLSPHNNEESDRAFVRRVSRYLQHYQGNKVNSFKIDCNLIAKQPQLIRLDEWIRFAIMKSVEELDVGLGWCSSCPQDNIVFPLPSLAGCSSTSPSLKHLILQRCILRPESLTDFDGFKRLTSLCLAQVLLDNCLIGNILSSCLLLESLTLDRCCRMDGSSYQEFNIAVASDRLTDLKVLQCENNVTISAPNLASLESIPYSGCSSYFIQAPRLARIYFSGTRLHVRVGLHAISIALTKFASCPALETLHLQIPAETPRILSHATYGNLKQLNLDIDMEPKKRQDKDDVDVRFALDFLNAAPLLEEFQLTILNGLELSKTNPNETRNHCARIFTDGDYPEKFTNDHLRRVKMQGFTGNWYEMQLAIWILEISQQLEMLVIDQLGTVYFGDGSYSSSHWRRNYSEKFRVLMEERFKGVKTDARIVFQEYTN